MRAVVDLDRACQALAAGRAVVVPNPPPMAYGLVATSATAINALKGRVLNQPVAVSLHDPSEWRRVAPSIDVPAAALDAVAALLNRRLSMLVPLRSEVPHPGWVAPAVRNGYLGAFNGRWARTAVLWDRFPRLFGSSANVAGEPPAASAAEALAMFGAECLVVDVDGPVGESSRRWASTMVRLDRHGRLGLHRAGAHDAGLGLAPDEYLRRLAASVDLPSRPDEHL